MPTYARTARFDRDYDELSAEQRTKFKSAVRKFVHDLPTGQFRPGLRVKGVQAAAGVFEMTWNADGRATFQYGDQEMAGEPHIIWRRIGRHQILGEP